MGLERVLEEEKFDLSLVQLEPSDKVRIRHKDYKEPLIGVVTSRNNTSVSFLYELNGQTHYINEPLAFQMGSSGKFIPYTDIQDIEVIEKVNPEISEIDSPMSDSNTRLNELRYLGIDNIRQINSNEEKLNSYSETLMVSQKRLKEDTAIILARSDLGIRLPGVSYTESELEYQARLGGDSIENFEHLYRFDLRKPEEITREGFKPNPAKKPATLYEHIAKCCLGSGNFVSTTKKEGNKKFIESSYFQKISQGVKTIQRINFSGDINELEPPKEEVLVLNEYRIHDCLGVCPKNHPIDFEEEVLISGASPEKIDYRQVKVSQKVNWGKYGDDLYIATPFDHKTNQFIIPTAEFGDWKNLKTD